MNINHPLNIRITESEAALFVLLCDAIFSYHLFINKTSVCISLSTLVLNSRD